MNQVRRRVPNYIDLGEPPQVTQFNSLKELLDLDWMKHLASAADFHRFSIGDSKLLLAEFKGGRVWYVVGFLENTITELPVKGNP